MKFLRIPASNNDNFGDNSSTFGSSRRKITFNDRWPIM